VILTHIRWIRSWHSSTDSVLAYAGKELARYLRKLTGAASGRPDAPDVLGVREMADRSGTAWLGICDQMPVPGGASSAETLTPASWDDGYAIWADETGLYIAGRNGRSVLFGVYAFLELQGVRYLRPGFEGEVTPRVESLRLPEAPIVEQPRYRHRGVCIEGAPSIAHALEMVDWCAKKRMNTVFLQFLSSRYFYNLWYERPYNPDHADSTVSEAEALVLDDQVIASMKKRGLVLHRVGHGWTSAAFGMPRSGWVTADEEVPPQYVRWLAEVNGERALFGGVPINTELCYSHPPAFEAFVETVVRYCEGHPELDVVHVWLSDATNNKCECDACRKLSISDWYARIINALSEALYHRVPRVRFVFLAYIELLWAPGQVALDNLHGNAILMFAPIARCYGHSLADSGCDDGEAWPHPALNQYAASHYNAFYAQRLADWCKAYGGDSFVYDYHLMWANWDQMTDTYIARLYHEDLQHLKGMGLDGIVSCQSFRVFYPSGLAVTALAEALWDPDVPWDEMRGRYLAAAFGEHAAFAGEYLATLESFLEPGDPHRRVMPLSNADAIKLAACAAFLESSLAEMQAWQETETDRARRKSFDLLGHHATWLQSIVRAYQARRAGDAEEAERQFEAAADYLRRTEPKYSTYIDTMLALRVVERAKRRE
jgi:hypothetical protein